MPDPGLDCLIGFFDPSRFGEAVLKSGWTEDKEVKRLVDLIEESQNEKVTLAAMEVLHQRARENLSLAGHFQKLERRIDGTGPHGESLTVTESAERLAGIGSTTERLLAGAFQGTSPPSLPSSKEPDREKEDQEAPCNTVQGATDDESFPPGSERARSDPSSSAGSDELGPIQRGDRRGPLQPDERDTSQASQHPPEPGTTDHGRGVDPRPGGRAGTRGRKPPTKAAYGGGLCGAPDRSADH